MQTYKTPGVYIEEKFLPPAAELRTGVPAFLGFTEECPRDDEDEKKFYVPQIITLWPQFEEYFGKPRSDNYLSYAVRGFFETGGTLCYVIPLNDAISPEEALSRGLDALAPLDTIDLICAPDIMWLYQQRKLPSENDVLKMQAAVLKHCETLDDRFAILDSLPSATEAEVKDHPGKIRRQGGLKGTNGALYYPWVRVLDGPALTDGFVPPCGHVAGVCDRSDQRVGVHKAPANEVLEGVLDLEVNLTNAQQGELNPMGVNCLRAFPGRGIRVWGARTLAAEGNAAWRYVNVRRLFLTVGRWIERTMTRATVVFEPNDHKLWARIGRELTAYCNDLFKRGALKGRTPQEAFYVKCDAETNSREVRDAGMVITEIGLAPTIPNEFVVIRIIHGDSGVTIKVLPTPEPSRFTGQLPATVRITHIEYDPEGRDLDSEYVRIKNLGSVPATLTNWTLSDLSGHTFVFPRFTLDQSASVRVWTKEGIDTTTDLYWGRRAAVWTNIGDRAYLRDSAGELVYVYTYTPIDAWLSR